MKFDKIHNKGQARLFKNRYLEFFTKTHPLVIWGMYLPLIVLLINHSLNFHSGFKSGITFFAGVFLWSLFEYLIHRYAFHFTASTERAKKFVYLIHGNHHEYPRDKQRLFMPALPSLLLSTTLFGLMYFTARLLNVQHFAFAFFPGFISGYLLYGSMHYAIHAWSPPFKWMKALWRNHHLHHYKEQEKGFGVSSTLWDYVFGTMFDKHKEQMDTEKIKGQMFSRNEQKNKLQEQ